MYARAGQGELLRLLRTGTSICNGAGEVVQQFQREQTQTINKGKWMKLQTYITAYNTCPLFSYQIIFPHLAGLMWRLRPLSEVGYLDIRGTNEDITICVI